MTNREKVIKGLEFHKNAYCVNKTEELCPYWSQEDCENDLASDALLLLKEQEPAMPTWRQGKAYCGKCGQRLPRKTADRKINYCGYCGNAVKWDA